MRPSWKLIVQTICQTNQAIATNPIGALCLAGGNEAKVLRQVECFMLEVGKMDAASFLFYKSNQRVSIPANNKSNKNIFHYFLLG